MEHITTTNVQNDFVHWIKPKEGKNQQAYQLYTLKKKKSIISGLFISWKLSMLGRLVLQPHCQLYGKVLVVGFASEKIF